MNDTVVSLLPFEVVPKVGCAHAVALRDYWLPFTVGPAAAADYASIHDLLLADLFPQQVQYGPHFDEFKEFCLMIDALVAVNWADEGWRAKFLADFDKAYGWDEPRPFPYWSDAHYQSYVLVPDRSVLLPKVFAVGGPPVPQMPSRWLPERLVATLTGQSKDLLLVPLSMILLQYVYLPWVLSAGYQQKLSSIRVLLRGHNAFCRAYGLPELRWASDDTLNTCG